MTDFNPENMRVGQRVVVPCTRPNQQFECTHCGKPLPTAPVEDETTRWHVNHAVDNTQFEEEIDPCFVVGRVIRDDDGDLNVQPMSSAYCSKDCVKTIMEQIFAPWDVRSKATHDSGLDRRPQLPLHLRHWKAE